MEYQDLINTKKHLIGDFGFKSTFIPEIAFDFQSYVINKACKRGRNGNFLDTGLGKTLIQLSISEVYCPVSQGRKAIGIELKDSYYKQAIINLKAASNRFNQKQKQKSLF